MRSPVMMYGSASGSSTLQDPLGRGQAHAVGGVAHRAGHRVEPGDGVGDEDQQGVGGERQHGGGPAQAEVGHQQAEQRHARDRVEERR